MRILITIPHFVGVSAGEEHGSLSERRGTRVRALTRCICALHERFGGEQYVASPVKPARTEANETTRATVEVFICTTRNQHVLADIPLSTKWFREVSCRCEPPLLGFECHRLLQDCLGEYDYYCYLEDDLVLYDSWFFQKLDVFCEHAGNDALLLPNRYEVGLEDGSRKVYIDGDLPLEMSARFQSIEEQPERDLSWCGISIRFCRARNPHSGCFFLSADQMEHWSRQSHFLDRDTGFVGPLESAATLGIMRTFRVYKPVAPWANFLEIEHHGSAWIRRLDRLHGHAGTMRNAPGLLSSGLSVSKTRPAACSNSTEGRAARWPIQSLWIGDRLGTMERLSIASFLTLGHAFHLYAYDELQDVPEGTLLFDAGEIIPQSEVFVYRQGVGQGSYAGFSDLFRYKLLLERGGWWVDLDVVALKAFDFGRACVLGYQGPREIGSAVMCAPPGCDLMHRCYEQAAMRRDDANWGEIGHELLTKTVFELELSWAAEPRIIFHPVDWRHVRALVEPGGMVSPHSYAVHLIRHIWLWQGQDPDAEYPEESIYGRLKGRYLRCGGAD